MGFLKSATTGAMLGAAAGMLIAPQLNRSARKKLIRSGNMMMDVMGDVYGEVMRKMR
jgi:gas vesicle protein